MCESCLVKLLLLGEGYLSSFMYVDLFSSSFMYVLGNDCVTCHTGADDVSGDTRDA